MTTNFFCVCDRHGRPIATDLNRDQANAMIAEIPGCHIRPVIALTRKTNAQLRQRVARLAARRCA